jgi:AcrR family transcriptional regulator
MSSSKTRILEAALKLLLKRGNPVTSMAEIAKAAGISRQALYLQFPDRASLFLTLGRYADEKRGLGPELQRVQEAPSGIAALEAFVSLQARMNPGIWPLFHAAETIRHHDTAVEHASQDRLKNRLVFCRGIVEKIDREGLLRSDLSIEQATDLLWTITSLRMWEKLVLQCKWSPESYQIQVLSLLRCALLK